MRTTIRIDDALYRRAKSLAAQSGRTVSDVIEDAVRASLSAKPPSGSVGIPDLPVFGGSGVQPGVDLSDNASLRDLMDDGEGLGALR